MSTSISFSLPPIAKYSSSVRFSSQCISSVNGDGANYAEGGDITEGNDLTGTVFDNMVYIFAGTTGESAARGAAANTPSLKIYGMALPPAFPLGSFVLFKRLRMLGMRRKEYRLREDGRGGDDVIAFSLFSEGVAQGEQQLVTLIGYFGRVADVGLVCVSVLEVEVWLEGVEVAGCCVVLVCQVNVYVSGFESHAAGYAVCRLPVGVVCR